MELVFVEQRADDQVICTCDGDALLFGQVAGLCGVQKRNRDSARTKLKGRWVGKTVRLFVAQSWIPGQARDDRGGWVKPGTTGGQSGTTFQVCHPALDAGSMLERSISAFEDMDPGLRAGIHACTACLRCRARKGCFCARARMCFLVHALE